MGTHRDLGPIQEHGSPLAPKSDVGQFRRRRATSKPDHVRYVAESRSKLSAFALLDPCDKLAAITMPVAIALAAMF
jgi:hypothetical protein